MLFPNARMIAFEASPAVHPSTQATFTRNGVDVELVTSAVGAAPGELSFYVDGNGSGWGFLNDEIGEQVYKHIMTQQSCQILTFVC